MRVIYPPIRSRQPEFSKDADFEQRVGHVVDNSDEIEIMDSRYMMKERIGFLALPREHNRNSPPRKIEQDQLFCTSVCAKTGDNIQRKTVEHTNEGRRPLEQKDMHYTTLALARSPCSTETMKADDDDA